MHLSNRKKETGTDTADWKKIHSSIIFVFWGVTAFGSPTKCNAVVKSGGFESHVISFM